MEAFKLAFSLWQVKNKLFIYKYSYTYVQGHILIKLGNIMNISINNDQKLYVLKFEGGVSAIGFETVYAYAKELAYRVSRLVGVEVPSPSKESIGTLQLYRDYLGLLESYGKLKDDQTWFDHRTSVPVQNALELSRLNGNEIRVFYGDTSSGKDWLEESDIAGRVSRSTGTLKVPLLIKGNSIGGSAILSNSIVRIIDISSGKELYSHDNYHLPELALSFNKLIKDLNYEVLVKNSEGLFEVQARFNSKSLAEEFISFLKGNIHYVR